MAIALTTPAYRVFQRDYITGNGTITVTGTGATPGALVEARWKAGAYVPMTVENDGTFTGTITGASGQGDLEVRQNGGAVASTVNYVGIGTIVIGTGASGMSGRGDNNQSYSHATLKACTFSNRYLWTEMVDPTDNYGLQVDTVSRDDSPTAAGSWIPHLATYFMAEYGYPLAYVPCAMGGTAVEDWVDIGVNRATLFGSMAYRMQQVGGAELCMFMTNGDNVPSFEENIQTFAVALPTYGCDNMMIISGPRSSGYTTANRKTTWKAQKRMAAQVANIVPGASLRARSADDSLHLMTDEKLTFAGQQVFNAIKAWKDKREGLATFRKSII